MVRSTRAVSRSIETIVGLLGANASSADVEALRGVLLELPYQRLQQLAACAAPMQALESASSCGLTRLCERIVAANPELAAGSLYLAALHGQEEIFRQLLTQDCSLATQVTILGRTALMALASAQPATPAAAQRQLRLAELLHGAGCPIDLLDSQGVSALQLAVSTRSYGLAERLLDWGATVPPGNGLGLPLFFHLVADAASAPEITDYAALARRLAAVGAPVNVQHDQGITPLMFLASMASKTGLRCPVLLSLLDALLDLGVGVATLDAKQRDVLNYLVTCLEGDVDLDALRAVVRRLVAAGADLNRQDLRGTTCLGYLGVLLAMGPPAPVGPARELLRVFVDAGADAAVALPEGLLPTVLKVAGPIPPHPCVPDVIRALVGVGCRADVVYLDFTLVQLWLDVINVLPFRAFPIPPPRRITAYHLSCLRVLLDCGSPVGLPADGPGSSQAGALVCAAVATGSLPLVRLLLGADPAAARCLLGAGQWSPLEYALIVLAHRLEELEEAQVDPQNDAYVLYVLHFCHMARLLLAAGSLPLPPSHEELESLPPWVKERFSFLPLVAGDVTWSPTRHAAFPPLFRQAVRTFVTINAVAGFGRKSAAAAAAGGGAAGEGEGSLLGRLTRAAKRIALGRRRSCCGCTGVQLPQDVVYRILELAADPRCIYLDWAPELAAFAHKEEGEEEGESD